MTLTIFDPRLLTTVKKAVHPLSDLGLYLEDVEATAREVQEQILDDAFRTEDAACLRDAEAIVSKLKTLLDDLGAFQREWIG